MRGRVDGRKKIIWSACGILTAVAVAAGAILSTTQTALAKPTLPGVEKIVYSNSNQNPFVILEVIPDKKDAALGFFVSGEEPVDDSGKSIHDMPSKEEREARMGGQTASVRIDNRITELGIGDAVSYSGYSETGVTAETDGAVTTDIRGTFTEVVNGTGDYKPIAENTLYKKIKVVNPGETDLENDKIALDKINQERTILYRKYTSYRLPASGMGGTWKIHLKELEDTNDMPVSIDDAQGIYNNQYFVATEITLDDNSDGRLTIEDLNDGDLIFNKTADTLSYVGALTNSTRMLLLDELEDEEDESGENEGPVTGSDSALAVRRMQRMSIEFSDLRDGLESGILQYVKVEEADGNDIGPYYYITDVPETGGELEAVTALSEVIRPEGGYLSDYIGKTFFIREETLPYKYAVEPGGTINGNHIFTADYTQDIYETFSYTGGFKNVEWFKKYVFDLETEEALAGMCIDVIPVTMDELSQELLDKADLLYFADTSASNFMDDNTATTETVEGLTEDMAKAILKKALDGVPLALNRSLYTNEYNGGLVRKLAACLIQENPESVIPVGGIDSLIISALDLDELATTMKKPLTLLDENGADKKLSLTYVSGNIFVYDDTCEAPLFNIGKKNIVSSDFDKKVFTDAEIENGFKAILEEIRNENFYLEVAGKTQRIEEKVTMATALRYIINFGDRRNVTKTTLRVLDLEPYDFEDYYEGSKNQNGSTAYQDIKVSGSTNGISVNKIETDSICLTADGRLDKKRWIIDNLAPQFEEQPDKLDVTIMGTKEFIGKLEDLNTEYDLIYLGMDTSIMNTEITNNPDGTKTKTDKTVYNDSSMNGLVYSHVGDEIGLAKGNEVKGYFRLSGNDITADKLRELREYIEAGYAFILSDDFLIKNGADYKVNTARIDSSSNMYKLIHDTVLKKENGEYRYYGKNVNSKSNFENTNSVAVGVRESFSRYMGISKLTLKYSADDLPTAYNQPDGTQKYLTPDADGIYHLEYDIELQNDAAVEITSTSYDCQLYVDADADGRFDSDERLTGLKITDDSGFVKSVDAEGRYHLLAGSTYHISREIPEGFTGFLAWKLEFCQNDRTYEGTDDSAVIRCAIEGFSAVPYVGEKPLIKILQITNADGKTNLDLDGNDMHKLYNGVQDFSINVTKMSSTEYIKKTAFADKDKSHSEYLKNYDMVVMGFRDMYRYGSSCNEDQIVEAILAIREYALSGRSIMFTHDLNSFRIEDNTDRTWGWYANKYLRDVQGMDRFGEVQASGILPEDEKYAYISQYDHAVLKGASVEKMGFSNPIVVDDEFKPYGYRNEYGENARRATWRFRYHFNYHRNGGDYNFNSQVARVNAGQITEYPYKISESFATSHSHPQYFQLNMDTDNRDANTNDDIVVWYTLSKMPNWNDSFFAANEMDVRNNYFIYNKGNVTYTGSGDKTVTSDEEKKLFVNTLVASYRVGMHAARALFKENQWETSATINSRYIPYDPQMNDGNGGFLEQDLPVHFYTSNTSLLKTNEPLYAKYYIDASETDYDLYTDGRYYKEVVPKSAYRIAEQDGSLIPLEETPFTLIGNSMHTVTFDYSELGLGNAEGIRDTYSKNIYVRLGYEELLNTALGTETLLPATESMNKLHIVCTQLFELR